MRLLPVRRKTIEMTIFQGGNFLSIHLRTNEELMGHLAVAATTYFQVIVLGCIAGSLRENIIRLFYYSTTYYYDECFEHFFELYIDRGLNCLN